MNISWLKKFALYFVVAFTSIYIIVCVLLYFNQEKIIFLPEKLPKDFKFSFGENVEEMNFVTKDQTSLNSLLFKSDSTKGLIFYLHGNAGSLKKWGEIASIYTKFNYDVLMLDYRGYGKSEGQIENEQQLHQDIQMVYDSLKKRYHETDIIILGYSIGTGMASKLASKNSAKLLILQAPYYSLPDLMSRHFSFLPTFILKYKFETYKYLPLCKMPIVLFHGDCDEIIAHESSLMLQKLFKPNDTLITLEQQSHNGITNNPNYLRQLREILQ
jgi:uncharacterized protein